MIYLMRPPKAETRCSNKKANVINRQIVDYDSFSSNNYHIKYMVNDESI
jgi:hypothetical protein